MYVCMYIYTKAIITKLRLYLSLLLEIRVCNPCSKDVRGYIKEETKLYETISKS